MKHEISRAVDADLPLMQRLFYETVTTYGSKIFTKAEIKIYSRLATNTSYWHKKFNEDFIYNAKINGEIIGSFSMDKSGVIEYIFVHQNYLGQGIASGLYKTIEEVARTYDIKTLTTQVNLLTRSFFEKNGFTIVKNATQVVGGEDVISYSGIKNLKI
ncbi:GNAT family N-acetyltransferase [Aquimarina sp. 2201CG5-10]|uniref:GNAT family N-acetyltransferase n=1 Tax=Aquimarina callyspongiae TaxID=3098150 RepID=UPI002AB52644|nr:GNAT family N-acetyltransferase [Aquimarina sp. 2201CG5-10]MDY8134385.1 GNAT family N-acetyltransferase [Aquimarina sp. 2201CG5-10]